MSERVVRITSQQGYADTWTNATAPKTLNLVDFTIPSGLVVDMSSSYISFNSLITNSAGEIVNASWWLNGDNDEIINVPNSALVRNCQISASNVGQLESVIRQDSLACGMWALSHTAEERKSDMNTLSAFNNGAGVDIYTTFGLDRVSNNVSNDGTTTVTGLGGDPLTSANVDRDIKIPLKDIFGVGEITDFDTSKWGEVSIHLETNMQYLESKQWGGEENTKTGFDQTTPQGKQADQTLAIGGSLTTVTSEVGYGEWEYTNPFYVGQTVLVTATAQHVADVTTPNGDLVAGVEMTIATMQFRENNTAVPPTGNNRVILGFTAAVATNTNAGTNALTAVLIRAKVDDATLQNTIHRAELVLSVIDDAETPNAYEYITYSSEQDNGIGLASFNRGYMVEPEAENLMVAVLNDNAIVPNRALTSYRYSIDNVSQTGNRDVNTGTPFQFDRLQRCLDRSAQIPFRNAQLAFYKATADQADVYDSPVSMICETLETSSESRMVNLNIESAGLQQIILYKQIPRQISL